MAEWQPIETAPPTDENHRIDVWFIEIDNPAEGQRLADAYWEEYTYEGKHHAGYTDGDGIVNEEVGMKATHWMPIPDGPHA